MHILGAPFHYSIPQIPQLSWNQLCLSYLSSRGYAIAVLYGQCLFEFIYGLPFH